MKEHFEFTPCPMGACQCQRKIGGPNPLGFGKFFQELDFFWRVMFDFNDSMRCVIREIAQTLPEFRHIDLQHIRISATYNRTRRRTGLLAYVLPLKYKNGSPIQTKKRGNRTYHFGITPTFHQGKELYYILYFMLPRFLNLPFRDKLETVIHELYHISPDFNGDLRRLKGRSYIHGNSLKEYDATIRKFTEQFLNSPHNSLVYEFFHWGYQKLENKHGNVLSSHTKEPRPKLIHVEHGS